MSDPSVNPGDIVQINPETHKGFFAGCFMVVTSIKKTFCEGYIPVPHQQGGLPVLAEYKAKWNEIVPVGRSHWLLAEEDED